MFASSYYSYPSFFSRSFFQINENLTIAVTDMIMLGLSAVGISDYTYVLENGHITLEGPSAQLLADPAVQKAYLGD